MRQARNSSDGQYPSAINGGIVGQGTYMALITPGTGSPITGTSTGTSLTSVSSTVTRTCRLSCAGKTSTTVAVNAYDSKGLLLSMFEAGGTNADFLAVDKSNAFNSVRTLIKSDLSSLSKNIPYKSTELMLDVQQHDLGREGGTL